VVDNSEAYDDSIDEEITAEEIEQRDVFMKVKAGLHRICAERDCPPDNDLLNRMTSMFIDALAKGVMKRDPIEEITALGASARSSSTVSGLWCRRFLILAATGLMYHGG